MGGVLSASGLNWFAVYTKPRQEHIALLNLEGQSFECYLPMAERPQRPRPTPKRSLNEAMFPRYLFLRADPGCQSLATVRSTVGVSGLVRAGSEPIKIPSSIIAGLKARMHPATGRIKLNSIALRAGDKVRVSDGPFADLEGIFKECRGRTRSLLLLEILGRQTAVDVDARLLRRAS